MRRFYAAIVAHVIASYTALAVEWWWNAIPMRDAHDGLYVALYPAFAFLLFPYYLVELTQRGFEARPACAILAYVLVLIGTYSLLRIGARKRLVKDVGSPPAAN